VKKQAQPPLHPQELSQDALAVRELQSTKGWEILEEFLSKEIERCGNISSVRTLDYEYDDKGKVRKTSARSLESIATDVVARQARKEQIYRIKNYLKRLAKETKEKADGRKRRNDDGG